MAYANDGVHHPHSYVTLASRPFDEVFDRYNIETHVLATAAKAAP